MNIKKLYDALHAEAAKVVVGQQHVLTQLFIALLAGGHVLMEGVPGTGKTLMATHIANELSIPYFSKDEIEARLHRDHRRHPGRRRVSVERAER